jgi:hypothetical protein
MWMSRLIVLPLLVSAAACTSAPAPRDVEPFAPDPASPAYVEPAAESPSRQQVMAAMTERCRGTVAGAPNASVTGTPVVAMMRDDWVQVDGIVEWRGETGQVARTCDMFREEDGVWRRRYLSYGPV